MASPSQSSHHVEDGDESSVSTTATDHDNKDTTTSVPSTPSLPPKAKKKKNRSPKSSSSTVKNNDNSHLTTAEQELYNSHARQIRQNAMQLLNNAEASPSSNRYYRSYHNDHHGSAIQPSTVLPVNNSNMTDGSGYSHYPRGVEASPSSGDLSVSQVASMAFGCIAHCLTESYRAASNYYSATTQPPMSYNDYRYETVGISGGESGNGAAAVVTNSAANSHIGELSRGGSAGAGNRHAVSYQDYNGYQQTMERDGDTAAKTAIINKDDGDTISNNNNNQSSGQKSTEQRGMGSNDNDGRVKVKGEYATVSLPSTYQGGK